MNEHEIRQLARAAALDQARRLCVEFPDILAELNRLSQAPPRPVREALAEIAAGLEPAPVDRPRRAPRGKYQMSAKGRAAIRAAVRRRWAAAKQNGAGAAKKGR